MTISYNIGTSVPIIQYDGASTVPDLTGTLNTILGFADRYTQKRDQKQAQQQAVELSGQLSGQTTNDFLASPEAQKQFARLQQLDPDIAQYTAGLMQMRDEKRIATAAQEAEEAKNYFSAIYNMEDPAERRSIILDRAIQLKNEGKDYSKLMDMLNLTPEQQRVKALRNMLVAGDASGLIEKSRQTATLSEGAKLVDVKTGQTIAEGAPKAPEDKTSTSVNNLRTRYDKFTADLKNVDAAYEKIKTAPESAAGDMSLIFGYMKLLDPGSTVREGEFATAQNTTGIPGRLMNAYNKAISGERLNADQRKEFVASADSAFIAQQKSADKSIADLLSQAEQDGLPPERVIGEKALKDYRARSAQKDITTLSDDDLLNF